MHITLTHVAPPNESQLEHPPHVLGALLTEVGTLSGARIMRVSRSLVELRICINKQHTPSHPPQHHHHTETRLNNPIQIQIPNTHIVSETDTDLIVALFMQKKKKCRERCSHAELV